MGCQFVKFAGITAEQFAGLHQFVDSNENRGRRQMFLAKNGARDLGNWGLREYEYQHVILLSSKRHADNTYTAECSIAHHYEPAPHAKGDQCETGYTWMVWNPKSRYRQDVPRDIIDKLYDAMGLFPK